MDSRVKEKQTAKIKRLNYKFKGEDARDRRMNSPRISYPSRGDMKSNTKYFPNSEDLE